MNQKSVLRSLVLFYLMRVAGAGIMLMIPIFIPFYRAQGIGFWGVALVEFIFGVAALALDVPTGRFADLLGRRRSLLIGRFALALGCGAYALSASLLQCIAAELLLAVGFAFSLGADEAFVRSLFPQSEEGSRRFAWVWSATVVIDLLSGAAAMYFGPWLFQIDERLPFEVAGAMYLLSVLLVYLMDEPPLVRRAVAPIRKVAHYCLRERSEIRELVLFQAGMWFFLGAAAFLYEPYLRLRAIDVAHDGVIFALLGVASGIASFATPALGKRLGQRGMQRLLAGSFVAALVLLGVWSAA
ncbi:MAG: MFS transporter, partial [Proteobacteria bacterium]|nr:MFS transporter [Pseudomonadota bacterium]